MKNNMKFLSSSSALLSLCWEKVDWRRSFASPWPPLDDLQPGFLLDDLQPGFLLDDFFPPSRQKRRTGSRRLLLAKRRRRRRQGTTTWKTSYDEMTLWKVVRATLILYIYSWPKPNIWVRKEENKKAIFSRILFRILSWWGRMKYVRGRGGGWPSLDGGYLSLGGDEDHPITKTWTRGHLYS
jgi:hypothetical protein